MTELLQRVLDAGSGLVLTLKALKSTPSFPQDQFQVPSKSQPWRCPRHCSCLYVLLTNYPPAANSGPNNPSPEEGRGGCTRNSWNGFWHSPDPPVPRGSRKTGTSQDWRKWGSNRGLFPNEFNQLRTIIHRWSTIDRKQRCRLLEAFFFFPKEREK